MGFKEDFEEWKNDNEGISFAEWKELKKSSSEHNTLTPITNKSNEPKLVIKRNWKDYRVQKKLYLSKWVYEKLKNELTISGKVNKILMDYFTNEKQGGDLE